MFSKGKSKAPVAGGGRSDKSRAMMAQMGFTDFQTQMDSLAYGNDNDDEDELMNELYKLEGKQAPKRQKQHSEKASAPLDLDKLQALAQADVDEDVSDTEDPELLAELGELEDDVPATTSPAKPAAPCQQAPSLPSTVSRPAPKPAAPSASIAAASAAPANLSELLQQRMAMYQQAIANAKASSEAAKVRRFERGLKTLTSQLKLARAGKPVPEEEIPPPVALGGASQSQSEGSSNSVPAPAVDNTPAERPVEEARKEYDQKTLAVIENRQQEYKAAALQCKQLGDDAQAKKYLTIFKQFERVGVALKAGEPVDLSQMPPPPPSAKELISSVRESPRVRERPTGQGQPSDAASAPDAASEPTEPTTQEEAALFGAPDAPKDTMEALMQRLRKYQDTAKQAEQAGDKSRVRRMGRIVKQYEDAIKAAKAGRSFDYEELPTPPGFAPIPPPTTAKASVAPKAAAAAAKPVAAATTPSPAPASAVSPKSPTVGASGVSSRQSVHKSQSEKHTEFLKRRQSAYRAAALEAKKKGDLELAKKYLTYSHGFDKMIAAAESGIPVDMSQVPPDPNAVDESFEVVESITDESGGDRNEMYKKLEQDLVRQIQVCNTNAQHFQKLGDVSSGAKFEQLNSSCRKDLDALRSAFKHGDPVPRFHYETRTFSLLQRCTELGDDDLELTVCRGISYPLPSGYAPKDLDTYVKFEFPYPNETPQKGETGTAKGTNEPEYNDTVKLKMSRKSRGFARILKSKALKCEIYYKRGFLKADKLLAAANLKLQPLENKCVLHESVDLLDERKRTIGGSLELRVRVRDPLLTKQVEQVKEKWLVIDALPRAPTASAAQARSESPLQGTIASGKAISMQVLRFEKQLIDKQLQSLGGKLSAAQQQQLQRRGQELLQQAAHTEQEIKAGGAAVYKEYCRQLEAGAVRYTTEARQAQQQGKESQARHALMKKKLLDQEVAKIRQALK